MRRQALFALLAGCAMLLAGLVVYSSLHGPVEPPVDGSKSTRILVAAHDLPAGAPLQPDSYTFAACGRSNVPAGALTEPVQLVDKVTKVSLLKNEPLTVDRVINAAPKRASDRSIPVGMRAIAAPVEALGTDSALLRPHAHADVLVSIAAGGAPALSQLVLQDVEILSVEPVPAPDTSRAANTRAVTLLVAPEDAERLVLASHEGALSLAMRNESDHQIVRAAGMNMAQLLHGATPLVAARSPSRRDGAALTPATVEVMRNGRSLEKIAFDHDREIRTVITADGVPAPRRDAPPQSAAPGGVRGAASASTATAALATAARLEDALQGAQRAGSANGATPENGAGYVTPNAKTVEVP